MKDNVQFGNVKTAKSSAPGWIKVDLKNLSGEVLRDPGTEEVEKNVATNLIVEFYSK